MAQPRYDHSVAGLGEANFEKLRTCKVLVVGAGGIGCELLKNLVLVGCEKLTVVDLDTIDVSNLNRQFLFRKKHVGKSKAVVAGEAIKRSDLGVPSCGGAFTPSTRVVSSRATAMLRAGSIPT